MYYGFDVGGTKIEFGAFDEKQFLVIDQRRYLGGKPPIVFTGKRHVSPPCMTIHINILLA